MGEPYIPPNSGGWAYTVPTDGEPADGPLAFKDFADSVPVPPKGDITVKDFDAPHIVVAEDLDGFLQFDTTASNLTCTIPNDTDMPVPTGSVFVVANVGVKTLTVRGGAGVVIQDKTMTSVAQWKMATLIKRGPNSWIINAGGQGGGGGAASAIVESSTAATTKQVVDPDGDFATVYTFTGTGSIRFSRAGLLDVLLQGGGAMGDCNGGYGSSGGAGGQVEHRNVYVADGQDLVVLVGAGMGGGQITGNAVGTSSFQGLTAVGGAPGAQYRDRTPGGGACGGSSTSYATGPLSLSPGMYGQGRILPEMRGGNANGPGAGGGVAGDDGSGYAPGADWGSPGSLGHGGGTGSPMAPNTGNGGDTGNYGNSGIVFIRVKD